MEIAFGLLALTLVGVIAYLSIKLESFEVEVKVLKEYLDNANGEISLCYDELWETRQMCNAISQQRNDYFKQLNELSSEIARS
jgi:hypothetical protein